MNLFKLLNIFAIFILVSLGFAVSARVNELDTPFLSIPRVAFETAVPTPDPHPVNKSINSNYFPLSVIDETKTGIFTTKLLDLIIPNISTEMDNIELFLSDLFEQPAARITITIDPSHFHFSIGFENPSKTYNKPVAVENKQSSSDTGSPQLIMPLLQDAPAPIVQQEISEPSVSISSFVQTSEVAENLDKSLLQNEKNPAPLLPAYTEVASANMEDDQILSEVFEGSPANDKKELDAAIPPSENTRPIVSLPSYGNEPWTLGDNPLTGLAPLSQEKLDRRPMMVKISNFPRSGRPHAGLSFADIVFEYYIGEEMNRFLALYYGNDSPQVGPIRSGSPVDSELTSLYQGIINYGNEDPQVDGMLIKALEGRALPVWKCPSPPIYGADSNSIIGVFGNTEELSSFADKLNINNTRPALVGMDFDMNPPPGSRESTKLGVEYSERNRGEWHYDPQTGLYDRWIENFKDGDYFMEPLVDRVNDQQLKFANVIIIFSNYTELTPTRYKIDLWNNRSGERALIFRDGFVKEGYWMVESPDQPIKFLDENGTPVALKPGNSWIVIADEGSSFEEVSPGEWEMLFSGR